MPLQISELAMLKLQIIALTELKKNWLLHSPLYLTPHYEDKQGEWKQSSIHIIYFYVPGKRVPSATG